MRGPVILRAAELAGTWPSLALRLAGHGAVVGGGGPEGASPRTASTTTTTTPPSEGARQPDPALLGSKLRCAAPSDAPPAACAARARSFDPPPHSYPRLLRLRRCCFPHSTPLHSSCSSSSSPFLLHAPRLACPPPLHRTTTLPCRALPWPRMVPSRFLGTFLSPRLAASVLPAGRPFLCRRQVLVVTGFILRRV